MTCLVPLTHEVSDLSGGVRATLQDAVMKQMTPTAVEQAMKLQDVMIRPMAKRITWFQAAEILGIS
jgi:hypothetical protein